MTENKITIMCSRAVGKSTALASATGLTARQFGKTETQTKLESMQADKLRAKGLFEQTIKSSKRLAPCTPLVEMSVNDQFHCYTDEDTDNLWLGFQLGMRVAERELKERHEWSRGYFCAVAGMLNTDGLSAASRELFASGGNPASADDEDKETFIRHGLMPDPSSL